MIVKKENESSDDFNATWDDQQWQWWVRCTLIAAWVCSSLISPSHPPLPWAELLPQTADRSVSRSVTWLTPSCGSCQTDSSSSWSLCVNQQEEVVRRQMSSTFLLQPVWYCWGIITHTDTWPQCLVQIHQQGWIACVPNVYQVPTSASSVCLTICLLSQMFWKLPSAVSPPQEVICHCGAFKVVQ